MLKAMVDAQSTAALKVLIWLPSAANGHSAQLRGHWAMFGKLLGSARRKAEISRKERLLSSTFSISSCEGESLHESF